jgi:hypothetical protein
MTDKIWKLCRHRWFSGASIYIYKQLESIQVKIFICKNIYMFIAKSQFWQMFYKLLYKENIYNNRKAWWLLGSSTIKVCLSNKFIECVRFYNLNNSNLKIKKSSFGIECLIKISSFRFFFSMAKLTLLGLQFYSFVMFS